MLIKLESSGFRQTGTSLCIAMCVTRWDGRGYIDPKNQRNGNHDVCGNVRHPVLVIRRYVAHHKTDCTGLAGKANRIYMRMGSPSRLVCIRLGNHSILPRPETPVTGYTSPLFRIPEEEIPGKEPEKGEYPVCLQFLGGHGQYAYRWNVLSGKRKYSALP